jgi:hypothetical protein
VLGIGLSAKGLTVAYTAPVGGNQEMIDIYGDVAVTTRFLTFDSSLGTPDDPGLEIIGGQLTQLNITVNGGFSLFGFNVAANDLMIKYSSALSSLELSGGFTLQFTDTFQASAKILRGGLIINTATGALSIDTNNGGLELEASAVFGSYGVPRLDISFSNGPNGINFSAMGELDLPDNIKVVLDKLDIVDGQLADIGLTVDAPVAIGDTGFYIDSFSGELDNIDNPSQLTVSAGATISFGQALPVPSIPGIFTAPSEGVFLVDATGNITISPTDLKLTGSVNLLGGLLGQGQATLDLNWGTGVYSVTGSFGMFDNIITFKGGLDITNQGDITLQATASVNVPPQVPFIGGDSLGNLNFVLQFHPNDWANSYIAAWASVNLFVTSFTFGFKIDFQGSFSLLNGNDVNAIVQQADTTQGQPSQDVPTTYACSYNISDPNAAGAQVTLRSLDFFDAQYGTGLVSDGTVNTSGEGASTTTTYTYYQLSHSYVILPTLGFDVYNSFGTNVGHVSFDPAGNFVFTPTGNASLVPTGATLFSTGLLTLQWKGDPGPNTALANVAYQNNAHYHPSAYYTSANAVIEVLQTTTSGTQELVDTYAIDSMGQGLLAASAEGALYTDTITDPQITQRLNTWSTTFTLPHGNPDLKTLTFSVSSGGMLLGNCTVDQFGGVHFTPKAGATLAPYSGIVHDDVIVLDWSTNPGSATSVKATYRSVDDRVINIDFNRDVAADGTGLRGQYTVEVVTYQPLMNAPVFTEATHYQVPKVVFSLGQPYLKNGVLTGQIDAASYVPGAAQGGPEGSTQDTKISLYYTQQNSTLNGTLMETLDYGGFIDNGPGTLATGGFRWTGFQNLPAGQYYVYAVINDGQNPQQYSAVTGPFTSTGPTPSLSAPTFLALTLNRAGAEQGTFSAAAGTALGVTMGFTTPVTIDATVNGGTMIFPSGRMATQFPFTYPSAAAATADLDGLQFVADGAFNNSSTVTFTATTDINESMYTVTKTVALLTPNTHLVVAQSLYGPVTAVTVTNGGSGYQSAPAVTFTSSDGLGSDATGIATIQNGQVVGVSITNGGSAYDAPPIVSFSGGNPTTPATATTTVLTPTDPDTSIITVTVTNPGGPDGQYGTNVMLQEYVSQGLSIESFTASQGTFDKATRLWNIGSLPISPTNAATLSLTLKADPNTADQQLTSMADASSALFNYPATDAANVVAIVPRSHDVVLNALTVGPTAVGAAGEWQFSADGGGGGPYTFTVAPGSTLPPGLVLTTTGFLSGLPTSAGNYTFAVTATSPTRLSATALMKLSIASAPIATAGSAYSFTVGNDNYQYFTVTPGSTLPYGLALSLLTNGNYVLSGMPTTPGFYSFSIRDNSVFFGAYQDMPMTLFVDAPITISPMSLPNAAIGSLYLQTINATGGSGGFVYGLNNGTVPRGLVVNPNGTVTGTIASNVTPGSYTFRIYAYDASGTYTVQTYALQVEPAIVITPSSLPAATINSVYAVTLSATGGSGSGYTFALAAGTLPAGLTLSPTGVISGTIPVSTLAADDAITVGVSDSNGTTATSALTLSVSPALIITPSDLGDTEAGADFSAVLAGTGGSGAGYTFAVIGGTLPSGLTLAANGTLSGSVDAAAAAGYYSFTVTATDSQGAVGTVTCTLFVDAALTVPTPKLPVATVGVAYSQQVTATGGSGIYTFAVTAGTLPVGLTLSTTGLLSGTIPATSPAGTYSFAITVNDSLGTATSCPVTLVVAAANVTWTGAVSTAWSNAANWSSHSVPGAGDNVTVPSLPTAGRCPVFDVAATVNNLIIQSGATLTLAGHAITVDGTVMNMGNLSLLGNENVTLAAGNDTKEGTWTYVGDGTGRTVTIASVGYFNLTINDSQPRHDAFTTAGTLNVAGNLAVACGTFAPTAAVIACGVSLSGTGILDAPAVLNDSGNWIVTGGIFNPDGGTVFLTGSSATSLTSANKPFANLTHSGTGTLSVGGNTLVVQGTLTNTAGTFQANRVPITAGGIAMTGGTFIAPMAMADTGDWSVTGGSFNANRGTVVLGGTNQHLSGNTAFFNLTKTAAAADTLTFQAGSTQTIGGLLTLKGAAAGKRLALRSSMAGSTWTIVPTATAAVSFVDVADSVNLGRKPVGATGSHNSGDDTGWRFA